MTDLRTPPVNDGDLFSARARQYALEKPLQRIHILEAGCGWGTGLDLGDREHHLTGVDMDAPDLRAHTCERPDLDAWHLGDLRTVPLPPRTYDIVHASYLIERVPHAELVLDRFVAALKPGGLLLVRLRDRNTAFGFLDRVLPRWAHARRRPRRSAARRPPRGAHAEPGESAAARFRVRRARSTPEAEPAAAGGPVRRERERDARGGPAGSRGRGRRARAAARRGAARRGPARHSPPPAVYDEIASLSGMQWYCVMRGLVITEEYTSRRAIGTLGAGSGPAELLFRLVSVVSRGRLTADHSEVALVIRKPENRFARVI